MKYFLIKKFQFEKPHMNEMSLFITNFRSRTIDELKIEKKSSFGSNVPMTTHCIFLFLGHISFIPIG
jgi:hypothetical protein